MERVVINRNPRQEIADMIQKLESGKHITVDEVPDENGQSIADIVAYKQKDEYWLLDTHTTVRQVVPHEQVLKAIYRRAWSAAIQEFRDGGYYIYQS